jgi:hypothetical protein
MNVCRRERSVSDNVTVSRAVVVAVWGDIAGEVAAVVMGASFDAHEHTTAVNPLLD